MPPETAQGRTSLPTISLVLGICSIVIFCVGLPLGIAAIITGAIGRGRARRYGQGGGGATAGIITGIVGSLISIGIVVFMFVGGVGIFSALSQQFQVAQQLDQAEMAARAYWVDNDGSYEGISTSRLEQYGYSPSSDVVVTAVSTSGGAKYCVEGYAKADPGNVIHMPADSGSRMTITVNNETYEYSMGGCPRS